LAADYAMHAVFWMAYHSMHELCSSSWWARRSHHLVLPIPG